MAASRTDLQPATIEHLLDREQARFLDTHPRSAAAMAKPFDLTGRVALVTGGGRGAEVPAEAG